LKGKDIVFVALYRTHVLHIELCTVMRKRYADSGITSKEKGCVQFIAHTPSLVILATRAKHQTALSPIRTKAQFPPVSGIACSVTRHS